MSRHSGKTKLGTGEYWLSDVSGGNAATEASRAVFKTEHLRDSKQHASAAGGLNHAAALFRIHRHRFLAEHRLAVPHGEQHVSFMAGVRSGYQYCVHFWRATKLGGRVECEWDVKFARGLLRLSKIAP